MKKQNKLGFLALIGLVAAASLFTVCKATGVGGGGDVYTPVVDQNDYIIEVGFGELRALQPTERTLLNIVMPVDAEEPDKPAELGEIALSDGNYIFGIKTGGFAANNYTVRVYDLNLDGDDNPDTPVTETPQWPLGAARRALAFELDGGSFSGANPLIVGAGEAAERPAIDPVKAGWAFDDWYDTAGGGAKVTWPLTVTEDVSVFARWTDYSYSVRFYRNDGTIEADPAATIIVATPAVSVKTSDPEPVLPAFTRPDQGPAKYTFTGWKDGSGVPFNEYTVVAGDLDVFAQWAESSLSDVAVSFDPCGGIVSPTAVMVTLGGSLSSLPVPVRPGYDFGLWRTLPDGGGTAFTAGTTVNGALTVYAQWAEHTYSVSYLDAGGGSFSGENGGALPTGHTYGTATTLPDGVKTGFFFDGWYADSAASVRVSSPLGATACTADITLYAKWTRQWTVSYDSDSGGTAPAGETVNDGTWIALPGVGAMTKTVYVFAGWKASTTGSTVYAAGAAFTVNSDVTFTAQWADGSPTIHTPPQGRSYGLGALSLALSVGAYSNGGGTLSYQWYDRGTTNSNSGGDLISGANTATLAASNISTASVGKKYYYVVVTDNANGAETTSATAEVWVQTLKERIDAANAAAAAGSTGSPTVIKLYMDEPFVGVAAAANITNAVNITIVSSNALEERTVTLSSSYTMLRLNNAGASVTLGSGVTLKGRAGSDNTQGLVYVAAGSFAMTGTSKITGNTADGGGGAVTVSGADSSFTMSGNAAITGNTSKATGQARGGGGVFVTGGIFTMNGGVISDNEATDRGGGGIGLSSGGIFIMNGGTISNNKASGGYGGGGVYMNNTVTTFTMNGGDIFGNKAANGGGVYIWSNGIFTMTGGTIGGTGAGEGNTATGASGGVYVGTGSVFTMSGSAAITGNNAGTNGGGVYVVSSSSSNFTMSGSAAVTGNNAGTSGGAVYMTGAGALFDMSSGTISNNTSDGNGSGVYMVTSCKFTMSGGAISNNKTADTKVNGGVWVGTGTTFEMSGGAISGNTAGTTGGGVYVNSGVFTMSRGAISGNTAGTNGGGVYVNSGSFAMSGGSISGNNAVTSGNGVYVNSGTFTMSGLAYVAQNNEVFLYNNKTIALSGTLVASPAAMVAVPSAPTNYYTAGRQVLSGDTAVNLGRFTVAEPGWGIDDAGKLVEP